MWTTNNGLLKGKDQGTMHYNCFRISWYVCTDIMVVIYRQDLFSDDLNALFDEFLKKNFQQFSLNESLLQLFIPMLDAIPFS